MGTARNYIYIYKYKHRQQQTIQHKKKKNFIKIDVTTTHLYIESIIAATKKTRGEILTYFTHNRYFKLALQQFYFI